MIQPYDLSYLQWEPQEDDRITRTKNLTSEEWEKLRRVIKEHFHFEDDRSMANSPSRDSDQE